MTIRSGCSFATVDHILWGNDFPHEVSRWPNSMEVMEEQLAGVPENEQRMMMRENVVEFFHLRG